MKKINEIKDKKFETIKFFINKSETALKALYLFKNSSSLEDISKYFNKVMSLKKISNSNLRIINLISENETNLHSDNSLNTSFGLLKEFVWTASIINNYQEKLKNFYIYRNDFENSILLGNYDLSVKLLNQIDNEYGKSLWSIKNRLNILQKTGGLEAQKAYAKSLNELDLSISTKILIYLYSIGAEENISYNHFERIANKFFERFNVKSLLE